MSRVVKSSLIVLSVLLVAGVSWYAFGGTTSEPTIPPAEALNSSSDDSHHSHSHSHAKKHTVIEVLSSPSAAIPFLRGLSNSTKVKYGMAGVVVALAIIGLAVGAAMWSNGQHQEQLMQAEKDRLAAIEEAEKNEQVAAQTEEPGVWESYKALWITLIVVAAVLLTMAVFAMWMIRRLGNLYFLG